MTSALEGGEGNQKADEMRGGCAIVRQWSDKHKIHQASYPLRVVWFQFLLESEPRFELDQKNRNRSQLQSGTGTSLGISSSIGILLPRAN